MLHSRNFSRGRTVARNSVCVLSNINDKKAFSSFSSEMAFMMPVVKNDWDIYKCNQRSRRVSECSNTQSCRSRKVSECKSEGPSLSTSPGSDFMVGSPGHRSVPANMSRQYSRMSSRTSQNSLQSPCKSVGSSPPKSDSQTSLNKFHNRLLDKLKRSLRSKDSDSERTSS